MSLSKSDYLTYRGKCKEFCKEAVENDNTLTMVRGYYHCPIDGKQDHWWCVRQDGSIFDPTVKQFKTNGAAAEYEVFDGTFHCEQCGSEIIEKDEERLLTVGRYIICSNSCGRRLVGI